MVYQKVYVTGGIHLNLKPLLIGPDDTRVLRPSEYDLLKAKLPRDSDRSILDFLLLSGMRYVEMLDFYDNPDWLNESERHIRIPREKKAKRKNTSRYVRLTREGVVVAKVFVNGPAPIACSMWGLKLRKYADDAGIGSKGMRSKFTRKTWECWLVSAYPNRIYEIVLSQGHSQLTAIKHYMGVPFGAESEKAEIARRVAGIF